MRVLSPLLLGVTMLFAYACTNGTRNAAARSAQQLAFVGDASLIGSCQAQDGTVLPGVTVAIIDRLGRQRTTVTDARGRYEFQMIPAGIYTVRSELDGYGVATRVINLSSGKTQKDIETIQVSYDGDFVTAEPLPPPKPPIPAR